MITLRIFFIFRRINIVTFLYQSIIVTDAVSFLGTYDAAASAMFVMG